MESENSYQKLKRSNNIHSLIQQINRNNVFTIIEIAYGMQPLMLVIIMTPSNTCISLNIHVLLVSLPLSTCLHSFHLWIVLKMTHQLNMKSHKGFVVQVGRKEDYFLHHNSRKTWKGIMLRNVLKRRRECGTYLATARRHRRRLKMQKRDE